MLKTTMKLVILAAVTVLLAGCFRESGVEVLSVTTTQVTNDNSETLLSGTDSMGRVDDLVLANADLQVIFHGKRQDKSRDLFLPNSYGTILDIATQFELVGSRKTAPRDDDGLNQVTQGVNMNRQTLVGYDHAELRQEGANRATLVLTGGLYDYDGSLEAGGATVDSLTRRVADCGVTTTYLLVDIQDLQDSERDLPVTYLTITTVLENKGSSPLPVTTLNDVIVTGANTYNTFVAYPGWGYDQPEGGAPAFPHYIHLQPRQISTTHYACFSRTEQLIMVNREPFPEASSDVVYVGKVRPGATSLAAGEQLTFIRNLMAISSGTNANSAILNATAYNDIMLILHDSAEPENIFSKIGRVQAFTQTRNNPAGTIQFGYINQGLLDTNYFNGTAYVPLELGRFYPIFGDSPIRNLDNPYDLFVPVGQMAMSTQGLNSRHRLIDHRTDAVTDENGNPVLDENGEQVTEDTYFLVAELDDFSDQEHITRFGAHNVTDVHANVFFGAKDLNSREIMARLTIDRTSGEGPIETGSFPRRGQDNFAYVDAIGAISQGIPQGYYDVLVSRGPLNNVNQLALDITELDETGASPAGDTTDPNGPNSRSFNINLGPAVSLDGYLSTDFDVRSSGDPLGLINEAQMMLMAYAEDIDVLFFAETNHQSVYQSVYDNLALSLAGFSPEDRTNEVDSYRDEVAYSRAMATIGKVAGGERGRFAMLNLPSEETLPFLQVPLMETDPAELYDRIRAIDPGILIQVTRPRAPEGLETGLMTTIAELSGLAPGTPIPGDNPYYGETAATGSNTRWIDFDLLQLLSGKDYDQYLLARDDWFNLLEAGLYRPATGGSQPGETRNLPIGTVRTYVQVGDTALRDNDLADFWSAVRTGKMFVTNGPIIQASVNGVGYGGTTSAGGGSASVQVSVSSAPWIPVDEVRLILDGQVVKTVPIGTESTPPLRYEGTLSVDLPAGRSQHWVVVEAGASLNALRTGQAETGTFGRIYPGHLPLAFTNPIFINN